MESLYLLVPVAIIFVVVAIRFLFWAINSGQYDDLDTEGQRILFDDKAESAPRPAAAAKAESTSSAASGAEPDAKSEAPAERNSGTPK